MNEQSSSQNSGGGDGPTMTIVPENRFEWRRRMIANLVERMSTTVPGCVVTRLEIVLFLGFHNTPQKWREAQELFRRAKKILESQHNLFFVAVRGIGYRCVEHSHSIDVCEQDAYLGLQKITRGAERTQHIAISVLTPTEQMRVVNRQNMMVSLRETARAAAPPHLLSREELKRKHQEDREKPA